MSYVTLNADSDYEILNEYPYTIRRKRDQYEVSESYSNGYLILQLNGKFYYKHRLIAEQFIPNNDPEHKTQVDHINHDRSDYHLSNLRWVSASENLFNKSSSKGVEYEYFDDIPDDSIIVDFYETRNSIRYFDQNKYYYYYDEENDEDVFYGKVKDDLYRRLHINSTKSGNKFVSALDANHKRVSLYVDKFKRQHDLI